MSSTPALAVPAVVVAAAAIAAVVGGSVGAVTARWLARLRRGARVPPRWCVPGVGVLWMAVASAWACGAAPGTAVPLLAGLCWLTVAGSAVDVAVYRLPDALTLPAFPVVLALLVPLGRPAVVRGALAAVVLSGAYGLVRRVAPQAMGGGDVKLAAAVGASLGGVSWDAVALGTVLAAALTAVTPLLVSAIARWPAVRTGSGPPPVRRARAGRARTVPHGPSMLVACLVVLVLATAGSPGAPGVG